MFMIKNKLYSNIQYTLYVRYIITYEIFNVKPVVTYYVLNFKNIKSIGMPLYSTILLTQNGTLNSFLVRGCMLAQHLKIEVNRYEVFITLKY